MPDFLSPPNAVTLASIAVAVTSVIFGAIQGTKAIVELKRGRSKGWLKVIFAIFAVPESQSERNIFSHPSGLLLIENQGPFEEFISALHYSIEGKGIVQVQCYRQIVGYAIDKMAGNSHEQKRFDSAIEASVIHSKAQIHAIFDISPTALYEWQQKNDAIRKEVDDAFKEVKNQKEDQIVIEYPLSVPAGSTRRIDFEIPEKWQSDLDSITCLTVQTAKEALHVKRAYEKPSLPCNKCRTTHRKNEQIGYDKDTNPPTPK